jgi:AcrR family transcriptional regulator
VPRNAAPTDAEHEPRSRRDRPAKPPLSRAAIVQAALEIVEREGIEAVTLRRVASALDTGPASLYVYVANRDDLLERALDRVLADVPRVPVDARRWRELLVELISGVLDTLDGRPGIAQVALGWIPTSEAGLAITENAFALLRAGGVSDQAAAWACDALMLQAVATSVEHSIELSREPVTAGQKSPAVDFKTATRERLAQLPPDRFPILSTVADTMTTGDDRQRFHFAISALIAGAHEVSSGAESVRESG